MVSERVWRQNSPKVLDYIIKHDSDILTKGVKDLARSLGRIPYDHEFPKNMAEILLAWGWDINARKIGTMPLLWHVIGDEDFVTWYLDHGAKPLAQDQRPSPDFDIHNTEEADKYLEQHPWRGAELPDFFMHCPPLLEVAADKSTVATFELLPSKGAAMGWRVLHKAVASSIYLNLDQESTHGEPLLSGKELSRTFQERLAMVRHLVDTLKLDVNALDCPTGWGLGNFWGRSLHYVAMSSGGNSNCRPVTWFLLDRGADLELLDSYAGMTAMAIGSKNFRDAVNEWRLMKMREAGQNIEKLDMII